VTTEDPSTPGLRPTFRSGAAARLAGIPVATLRVWERRYGVVGPQSSPRGHRRYSAEDVSRLALLKQLVDEGNPIGSIAGLSLPALREMRAAAESSRRQAPIGSAGTGRPLRVALVGAALAERSRVGAVRHPALEIVGACAGEADAAEALQGMAADLLAIELPTLGADSPALVDTLVRASGARGALVAYRFGPEAVIAGLRDRGHVAIRAPLDFAEIERLGATVLGQGTSPGPVPALPLPFAPAPRPRFDDQALAGLARGSTTMYCECPHHIVELLLSLGAFERYSAECEHRSPADAALHRDLHRVAGWARALFEDALVRLAQAEGLALPEPAGAALAQG
jgi:hypothetical protein